MLHGRILCTHDIVSFGGVDLADLENNFREALDEYLSFCKETGKTPDPPTSFALEVSLKQDVEADALRSAEQPHRELNSVVNDAVQEYLARAS